MADEEQPRNVKELLVELKDASELMVDLAYAAVFFNEEDLAEEVEELEERMDGHLRRLRDLFVEHGCVQQRQPHPGSHRA